MENVNYNNIDLKNNKNNMSKLEPINNIKKFDRYKVHIISTSYYKRRVQQLRGKGNQINNLVALNRFLIYSMIVSRLCNEILEIIKKYGYSEGVLSIEKGPYLESLEKDEMLFGFIRTLIAYFYALEEKTYGTELPYLKEVYIAIRSYTKRNKEEKGLSPKK